MNIRLAPYSEYKDSGLPWLGRIPKHWEVRRFKYLLREVNSRSSDGQDQLLSVSQYTGVTPRGSRDGSDEPDTRAASLVGYKRVAQDDLVVNIMLAWNGSLGVAHSAGIVSPAYCVYRFNDNAESWYYHNLLRLPLYKGRIKVESTGVVESRLRLYSDDLFRIEAFVPPKKEQAAIARFASATGRQVDRLIRAKRRLIELLNEQKQAIIHRAVTRGLDPNVRLKLSGVDWLGEVPEHWEVLRSKYIFREVDKRSTTGTETHLSMSQRLGLIPSSLIEERRLLSESYTGGKLCEANDLVLNRLKAHLGVFALASEPGLISPDYTVLRAARSIAPQYFEFVFRTPACRVELRKRAKGIVQGFWRLYTDDLYDIALPVPPHEEQMRVVAFLQVELLQVNNAIDRAFREIDLLREYRTRLIADVVTGKLAVRGVELPSLDEGEAVEDLDTGEDAGVEEMTDSDEAADGDEQ